MAQGTRRPKGTGSETRNKHGIWVATRELPPHPITGKRRRITAQGRTRSEARRKVEAKLDRLKAEGTVPGGKAPQLRTYMDHWLKTIATRVKPRVVESYRSECNALAGIIGGMRLDTITPAVIENTMIELGIGRSGKTVLNYWTRLKQIMHTAMRDGLIDTNPVLATEPPRAEATPTRILQAGEPAKAIQASKTPKARANDMIQDSDDERLMWALNFSLAFSTGLRQAERFAITPAELITQNGVHGIQVEWELQRLNGTPTIPGWLNAKHITGHYWLLPPKSKQGKRFVPVDTETWLGLQALAQKHHCKPNQLIFTKRDGTPLSNPMERRRWIRACQDAGLPYVTIRSARHFFSTALAQTGAADDARMAMMGHAKISTTAGYTHWSPEALAALADSARMAI